MLTFRRAAAGGELAEPRREAAPAVPARGPSSAAAPAAKPVPAKPYAVAAPAPRPAVREPVEQAPAPATSAPAAAELSPGAWTALALRLDLRGPARELAHNASLLGLRGSVLQLAIKPQHESFRNAKTEAQLRDALAPHLGALKLEFRVAADAGATSAADELKREREARLAAAESALTQDPVLNALISEFDARIVPGSVRAPE
jgi:DNA polymerase-3 subunit gamma/tau